MSPPSVPGIPGTKLPDQREENALLRRRVREAEQAAEQLSRLYTRTYEEKEVFKARSERPPPPPVLPAPIEQSIVVQGLTWKAALPIGALLTFAASAITQCAAGPNAKIERLDERLADEVKDRNRNTTEQDRLIAQILQRQDRIETTQSLFDTRMEDLRRKLRDKKEE